MRDASDQPISLVEPGMAVYTEDGHHLGQVTAVRTDAFHIGGAFPFGYWLFLAAVATVTPDRVMLLIPHAWLRDCTYAFPPAA
jgi:hypothetical protein